MTRLTTTIAATAALIAAPAAAMTWDTNDDGSVDAREFVSGYANAATFDRFDDDGNGALTPQEVGLTRPDAVFLAADANHDGTLSMAEIGGGTFRSYDRDRNALIDRREMEAYERDSVRGTTIFENDAPREGSEVSQ